jgi:hypothetical protein
MRPSQRPVSVRSTERQGAPRSFRRPIQQWAEAADWHVYDYADRLLDDLDAAGYEITRSAGEHGGPWSKCSGSRCSTASSASRTSLA